MPSFPFGRAPVWTMNSRITLTLDQCDPLFGGMTLCFPQITEWVIAYSWFSKDQLNGLSHMLVLEDSAYSFSSLFDLMYNYMLGTVKVLWQLMSLRSYYRVFTCLWPLILNKVITPTSKHVPKCYPLPSIHSRLWMVTNLSFLVLWQFSKLLRLKTWDTLLILFWLPSLPLTFVSESPWERPHLSFLL